MNEQSRQANTNMQDAISKADLTELREISKSLDDLKAMVEDHIMAIAGQGGDW